MSIATADTDYKVRTAGHKTAGVGATAGDQKVVDFLQLLGRAARQFHTYPSTSPLCIDAIDACHRAFATLDGGSLMVRVASRELIVDEARIGRGGVIEQDLARPLHRARVASLEIDHAASVRDWSQFCAALCSCHRPAKGRTSFGDLLLDAGVAAIVVQMVPRPEVVELGAPPHAVRHLVERERARQTPRAGGAPVQYFYPPDKGWIRFDPSVRYDSLSLLDLAVVVNDPTELAAILMRLTNDDDQEGATPGAALEQKYGDLVTLISALDPRLARQLLAKLARAVLDLDSHSRQRLLRRAILPGLLDGALDSETVLSEFPDVDLAEALCLLLDLETAAPELLPTAIDRLHLTSERRDAVVPLITSRLQGGPSGSRKERRADADLSRYAEALIRVDSTSRRSFAAFAGFDLSINADTVAALVQLRHTIAATAPADARLDCLATLTSLEPNLLTVGIFVERSVEELRELVRAGQWCQLSRWLTRFLEMASALQTSRPDVANAVRQVSVRFCDRDVVLQLADLCGRGGQQKADAEAIVSALGGSIVPAWLEAFESAANRTRLGPLAPVLSAYARKLAPAIARSLSSCGPEAQRVAMGILGAAGAGYEAVIAAQLPRGGERVGREALQALARIGTSKAAAVVVDQLEHGPRWVSVAAEDALWRLPVALASASARELLGRRSFVVSHPEPAARLFARVAQTNDDLTPLLESLVPLRYRFWNRSIVRIGVKARELLR